MKIRFESAKVYHPETHELLGVLPKSTVTISIQDVSNMPIFCLSHYDEKYVGIKDDKKTIEIDDAHIEGVKRDFPKATHALVILEPAKFISSVHKIVGKRFVNDEIKYYDYDINTLQMYMYLTTGDTELKTNEELAITYEKRYRHLLCKDISFEGQREFRFVELDELINEPVFYNFNFDSKYLLVPINKLTKHIIIEK